MPKQLLPQHPHSRICRILLPLVHSISLSYNHPQHPRSRICLIMQSHAMRDNNLMPARTSPFESLPDPAATGAVTYAVAITIHNIPIPELITAG